jgi:2-keto-myo-inositol isomerase
MTPRPRFALNHIAAPKLDYPEFFDLAKRSGFDAVELRNEMDGVAIRNGTPPEAIRDAAQSRNLQILSINALRRFNEWNSEREDQARALARYAMICGAEAIVICPVNDSSFQPEERLKDLRDALLAVKPILADCGVSGLIEVVGFPSSSLSLKQEAIEAIDSIDGQNVFRLVHDTFHHYLAKDPHLYPERTGLVHISGMAEDTVPKNDAPRILVDAQDRMGSVSQVAQLIDGGYRGYISFEPFSSVVQNAPDVVGDIRRSAEFVANQLDARAAR